MPIEKASNKSNSLELVLNENSFADMILNFLGKKQSLSYKLINQNFKIEHNDLEQFYYLLQEKLEKENTTKVNHFNVTIQYFDNTHREINTIESLAHFLETRNVSVKSVSLRWNIITNYPNANTIENQIIEVSFNILDNNFSNGDVFLNVQHTNQAWGIEVLNLFKDHISSLIIPKTRRLSLLELLYPSINIINILPLLFAFVFGFLLITNNFKSYDKEVLNNFQIETLNLISKTSLNDNEKIDRLLSFYIIEKDYNYDAIKDYIHSEEIKSKLLEFSKKSTNNFRNLILKLLGISIVLVIILFLIKSYILYSIKYYSTGAYILLTKKSITEYNNFLSLKSKFNYYSFSLIIFSILCSIIASIIYKLLGL